MYKITQMETQFVLEENKGLIIKTEIKIYTSYTSTSDSPVNFLKDLGQILFLCIDILLFFCRGVITEFVIECWGWHRARCFCTTGINFSKWFILLFHSWGEWKSIRPSAEMSCGLVVAPEIPAIDTWRWKRVVIQLRFIFGVQTD